MRAPSAFFVVAVCASFAAMLLPSCTHSCTLVACFDGVSIPELAIGRAIEELDDGRVRVCRDGDCAENAVVYIPSTAPESHAMINCGDLGGRSPFSCSRVFRDGAYVDDEINVSFVGFSSEKPPREGEVFLVEVRTKDGAVVASRSGAVHYEKSYPNGPDCGGACLHAALK